MVWGGSFREGLAMPLSERMCCRDLGSSSQPEETDDGTLSSAILAKVKNGRVARALSASRFPTRKLPAGYLNAGKRGRLAVRLE